MTTQTKNRRGFWQNLLRRDGRKAPGPEAPAVAEPSHTMAGPGRWMHGLMRRRGT